MNKFLLGALVGVLISSLPGLPTAGAQIPGVPGQSAVLSEIYGQGVHAYHAGRTSDAYDLLSMAIDNGIKDPRAYYFRGIVANESGRPYEAESDWKQGAELEARVGGAGPIGRALARYQGAGRLKLEEFRQKARLKYLAESAARSRQRYGEIEASEANVLRSQPSPQPSPRPTPAAPNAGVAQPPAPPIAEENPFADELGQPNVESDDALADAMNDPFADDAAGPAAAADAPPSDPFSDGGAADPFGGGDGGAMEDPFGTDAGTDPFADPFGN